MLLIFTGTSFGQSTLKGKIIDGTNNDPVEFAKITILGTDKRCVTNSSGEFELINLEEGEFTLEVKAATYNVSLIKKVKVGSKETKELQIDMLPADHEKGTVTVTRKVKKDGVVELIKVQHNLGVISNGISAEDMKKAPDPKASDILKRVTGASIQDNRFIVIRGLSDRYNYAFLNGAPLPSSETDRKAFSIDIFPSNVLSNIRILKTASPELPGEFAGGVISINTVEPTENNYQNISIGGSYHAITTLNNFYQSRDSKLDIIGLGSIDRSLPSEIPSTEIFATLSKDDKARLAQNMKFNWSPISKTALPNTSFQYSLGRNYNFEKNRSFGFAAAYSYQNSMTFSMNTRREFEESATGIVKKMELKDSVFNQNVLNTGMLNFKYNIGKRSYLQLKNLASITSDDKINIRTGVRELDNDPHQYEKATNFWYTQNKLMSSQLIGKHDFEKWVFNWNLGRSDVDRVIPALRRVVYRKYALSEDDPYEQYVAIIQNNGTIPTAAGNMFWSEANEKIYNANYDIEKILEFDSIQINIKIGGMHQFRDRDFTSRNFGFSKYSPNGSGFNSQILLESPSSIFEDANLGMMQNGMGGFKLDEATNVDDSYQASSILNAGFIQFDSKYKGIIKFFGGVRIESYGQSFRYTEFGSNAKQNIDTTVIDFLPSGNVILSITPKMNVRASTYKTVSRPEFRELAPFTFYNFVIDNIVSGDPSLKRAVILNYDVRYEYLIGNGQNFNISGFYKDFTNPIELINRTGTSGAPELYYTNVLSAKTYGAEIEYRFNLGILSKKKDHPIWDQLSINLNGSLIRSSVNTEGISGQNVYAKGRPLQGQSPYIINAAIYYQSLNKEWSVSAAFNRVGQRIYIVGNEQEPSVWENGRNMLDFQVVRTIKDKFEIRCNIKDALAQELVFFQDINKNYKYDKGIDNDWQNTTFGQSISISLKYNF